MDRLHAAGALLAVALLATGGVSAADLDGDGVRTVTELGDSDPLTADSDGDGLDDGEEREAGSDPNAGDTDGDGLGDAEEVERGTDPVSADSDDDGLADGREFDVGTDPTNEDTDGDGLLDGAEVAGETEAGTPLPDADPRHMDLYVEIYHSLGVDEPSPRELQTVEEHFAEMPVENPDNSTGIRLHTAREGVLHAVPDYNGSNYDAISSALGEALNDRGDARYATLFGEFADGAGFSITISGDFATTIGLGDAPGRHSLVNGSHPGRADILVHELLHNVVGDDLRGPAVCSGDPTHWCRGGWLSNTYTTGSGDDYLPEPIAEHIEDDGFENS